MLLVYSGLIPDTPTIQINVRSSMLLQFQLAPCFNGHRVYSFT